MKPIVIVCTLFGLLFTSACNPAQEVTTPAESPAEVSAAPEATAPSGAVSAHYIDAAAALYEEDFDKAKTALTALAAEATGDLQTRAQAAADAKDIAAMRQAFKELSDIAAKMELPPDYAVASCPMFKPGTGSLWVQKRGTLANPYYGKTNAMSTCGAFLN